MHPIDDVWHELMLRFCSIVLLQPIDSDLLLSVMTDAFSVILLDGLLTLLLFLSTSWFSLDLTELLL